MGNPIIPRGRVRTSFCKTASISFSLFALALDASIAQTTNCWTSSVSGYWESNSWSLGQLPGTNQNILFTNAGWKALAIGPGTVQNHPETLTVNSIVVSSPGTDTVNTLLLNYAGFDHPLVTGSLSIRSNCAAVLDASALNILNHISLGGTFTQDQSTTVTCPALHVGDIGPAIYNLNSGTLSGNPTIDIGSAFVGVLTQNGGTNYAGYTLVSTNSEFDLTDGLVANTGNLVVNSGGKFHQSAGVCYRAQAAIDGTFLQSGGYFGTSETYFPNRWNLGGGRGVGIQTDGTNSLDTSLYVGYGAPAESDGQPSDSSGHYVISNGVLNAATAIYVQCSGTLDQWNGQTSAGTLSVQGAIFYYNNVPNRVATSDYELHGGWLSTQHLLVGPAAAFSQAGGTNAVAGDITITGPTKSNGYYHGNYALSAGTLSASNIMAIWPGGFTQSGGQLLVTNIQLQQGYFAQSGGTIQQSGTFALEAATCSCLGTNQFGKMQLGIAGGTTPTTLTLGSSPGVLRFADSSSLVWSNQSILKIESWSGSLYGGGQERIVFGNNAAALTLSQLSQIQFHNPAGLPAGTYPARILADGEIVPDSGATLPILLGLSRGNGPAQLTLEAAAGSNYVIQVSTNLINWKSWSTQLDDVGTVHFTDSDFTNYPVRFYRAVWLQ